MRVGGQELLATEIPATLSTWLLGLVTKLDTRGRTETCLGLDWVSRHLKAVGVEELITSPIEHLLALVNGLEAGGRW